MTLSETNSAGAVGRAQENPVNHYAFIFGVFYVSILFACLLLFVFASLTKVGILSLSNNFDACL